MYSSVGTATNLEYIKTKTCSEKGAPVWFSDSNVPSIHGEMLEQNSTLAKEKYKYDAAGRLIEAEETPTGKGCVSRVYGYDEESNRTSLTSRESATETCASEGGVVQGHAYDSANRPIDSGVEYETFGNTTKLPAIDAGEHEITSTYYVDNQVATQKQNEETVNYTYDPDGRPMETVSEGKTSSTVISHYAGSGSSPTWTSEGTEKWTRNIPGIDGALDAIQTSAGSTVLQLHDLQGNIVGTASLSESETKLISTYNSTEFGVPQPGTTPPKYAWLGADGVSSEPSLSAGVSTEGGASYVPQVARSLQTDPVIPPGAFPNGSGTESPYTSTIAAGIVALNEKESAGAIAEYIAKQEALKRKAEEEALETAERIHREEGERPSPNEGGAGGYEEEEGGEIDPTKYGKYAQLHSSIDNIQCDEEGCRGMLHYNAVIPDRGKQSSELQITIEVATSAYTEPIEAHPAVYNHSSTPSYQEEIFVPYGTEIVISLYVEVGRHNEHLRQVFGDLKVEEET
jgi:hypothetical protein